METIFTVSNNLIGELEQTRSVQFFRNLLFADARRLGIPINKILISTRTNVADGGIDAKVEPDIKVSDSSGLITTGLTSYQIKSGTSFKPTQVSSVQSELFDTKPISKSNLGAAVKACLDKDGRYILVCFGQEFTDSEKAKAEKNVADLFKRCGYINPKVEVWGQSAIIGFSQIYPSLLLQLKDYEDLNFRTHKSWSTESNMRHQFKAGKSQEDFIVNVQTELRRNDQAIHIRICGEPGSGKTKLALEITKADDLAPLVIYCDSASNFRDSNLINEILKEDNLFSAILIIDECNVENRAYIWNKLQHIGPRIKLVTIYNEADSSSGTISYNEIPLLEKSQIIDILEGYAVQRDQADRWAELCGGSPRVAHVIGWNLKNNPEDILKPFDTIAIWDRYIVAGDNPSDIDVKQRQTVLRHIALFKMFGVRKSVKEEATAISEMIKAVDPQITKAKFSQIIKILEDRKILQGENTLYITPKALHIQLWKEWWEMYGDSFDFKEFSENLPDSLKKWFYEMFKYAAESDGATKVVEDLLGEDGPFQKDDYLKTALGSDFFLALVEANPTAALNCLKKTLGTWSLDETLNLKEPRRNLVWSLEKIAIWENLFQDAATLLLKLGEAENENYGNNASGTFIDLFSLGPGEVAPTEAAPENRFPVLEEALKSSSKPRRLLALKAFGTALQTNSFHRFVGSEYQGLRKAKLWRPANINEQISAYQKVLKLLYSNLETLDEEEKQIAIKTLLDHLRGLLQITQLADEILQDLKSIIQKEYIDIREILKTISLVLHYDRKRLPQNIVKQLEEIESSLVGDDFHSLSKRYIGMELIEDRYDENGKRADKAEIHLNNLADQVIKNKEIIMPELNWLITEDAKNGYRFGHALGIKDKNFELLDTLLEKHREFIGNKNVSDFFLGGYFKALNELDSERWESIMDMLSDDPVLLTWVPSLTWRSGYTSDRAAARILELAKHGKIKPYSFRAFGLGSVIQDLSEDIFQQCIKFLLSCSEDYAISIVMDLYHFFYLRKDAKYKLPEDLTLEILTHPLLFKPIENGNRDQMDDYHWKEISLRFIDLYPKRSLELADQILAHFGEEGTIIEGYRSEADEVITTISAIYPDEIWGTVSKYLGPPIDARSYHLKSWLRGNGFFETEPGTLNIFNPDRIWAWVDEAPERRAWYLATFVPKTLFKAEGKICWAREILVRYGEREAVRGNLIANFYSEGWSGPASIHYQLKRDGLVEFRKDETDEKVKKWLDEIIAGLNKDIEREKIVEERRGF